MRDVIGDIAKYSGAVSFPTFYYSPLRLVQGVLKCPFVSCALCGILSRRFPWTQQTLAENQVLISF